MNLSVSAILLYSIVAAAISVYLPFLLVAYARAKVGYDTSAPRAMFDQLPDYAKRATWAHQNGFVLLKNMAARGRGSFAYMAIVKPC